MLLFFLKFIPLYEKFQIWTILIKINVQVLIFLNSLIFLIKLKTPKYSFLPDFAINFQHFLSS